MGISHRQLRHMSGLSMPKMPMIRAEKSAQSAGREGPKNASRCNIDAPNVF